MSQYTAIYEEDDDGFYVLLMIVTRAFLDQEDREVWLVELAQELAAGDLWKIRLVEGESMMDFPPVLSGEVS